MGKKSRRNNSAKKEKEPLYKMVSGLYLADNFDAIRKLEPKYRNLETFSNDPLKEFHILHAFGLAYAAAAEDKEDDGSFCDRTIHYYERVKQLISTNADEKFQTAVLLEKMELYSA